MNLENKVWDTIVVGGGPAGMTAAGRSAELGKTTLLLEKNNRLGEKLLITGGGRCNVTNNKLDFNLLVSSYKDKPKALYSLFSQFGAGDTLDFFNSRGMETKVEAEDRVFPVSDSAVSVWQVLQDYISNNNVEIMNNSSVISVQKNNDLFIINTNNGSFKSKSLILAVGGKSRPETGSTGDGFKWLEDLGHTIIDSSLALVPIAIKTEWIKSLPGLSFADVGLNVYSYGKKTLELEANSYLLTLE
ncbi:MAG: aminoacetone oxidase family FAD-binding enzyme [Candidatus Dojkabacteria bacterium]|nr:aminoacetone oxidase family FAD-binding enzyme [Candidatus Dojkabacteria bacterium]MDQ7021646.1 aminoacetone oxidase family FAD-binding enzyme [Candidatus Dojkabacteria bacterium]